jgi:ADP-ribosylglycohydrolase
MGLLGGRDKHVAYRQACETVQGYLDTSAVCTDEERKNFTRIFSGAIGEEEEGRIHSSGYVLHTLEASIWCLLNTSNYEQAVLRATNLGSDTDTTAAVTGGLAGLLYGWQTIPEEWLSVLARRTDIENLAERLGKKLR